MTVYLYFLMKLSINYMFRNWHPHVVITHQNSFIAALFWISEYICKGLKSTSGQRFHFVYYNNNVRGRSEEGNRNWNVEQNCASVNSFFSKCIKSAARIFTGPYMKSKHESFTINVDIVEMHSTQIKGQIIINLYLTKWENKQTK